MKKSLSKPQETADTAVLDEVDDAPGASVAVSVTALGQVDGEVDRTDLITPRFNIVQGVGPLSEHFTSGTLVLNKDTVIAPAGDRENPQEPIFLTVLSAVKSYEEVLPYDASGGGPRPRTYSSIRDVHADDLWIDWRNDEKPPARPVAELLIAIEKPDGLASMMFNVPVNDKEYALALWTVRSTAYTRVAKKIFSANQIELKASGLLSGRWSLFTQKESIAGNPVSVPVFKLVGRNEGAVQGLLTKAATIE